MCSTTLLLLETKMSFSADSRVDLLIIRHCEKASPKSQLDVRQPSFALTQDVFCSASTTSIHMYPAVIGCVNVQRSTQPSMMIICVSFSVQCIGSAVFTHQYQCFTGSCFYQQIAIRDTLVQDFIECGSVLYQYQYIAATGITCNLAIAIYDQPTFSKRTDQHRVLFSLFLDEPQY